ncbi:MAG: BlaI/MecI/CopY family transcriptional regulator [Planctomycetota bacterium]|nr:BlaI/MecI/CopY family transcriptional regulator [Planctomycetota bacterium]
MPRRPRTETNGKPTDSECTILSVLWARDGATVREVFEELNASHQMGYTTVLKFMQIMTDKGLLTKDATVRPQVYRAAQPRQATQQRLVKDLLDRAFSGSPGTLALQALAMRKSAPEELREIRALLDTLEAPS